MTTNFSCVIINFIGILLFGKPPILVNQLLYINLLMDMFAVVALATEPPTKSVIADEQPYGPDKQILNEVAWRHIICMTLWNTIACTLVMFFARIALSSQGTECAEFSWKTGLNVSGTEQ